MRQQQAIDCEAALRELITQTRGYSQYQALLNIRREIRVERKEEARLAVIAAQEKQQMIMSGIAIFIFLALVLASGGMYMWWLGWIKF